jgi:hypothetical protein
MEITILFCDIREAGRVSGNRLLIQENINNSQPLKKFLSDPGCISNYDY